MYGSRPNPSPSPKSSWIMMSKWADRQSKRSYMEIPFNCHAMRAINTTEAKSWIACEQKTHFRYLLLSSEGGEKRRPEMRLLFQN